MHTWALVKSFDAKQFNSSVIFKMIPARLVIELFEIEIVAISYYKNADMSHKHLLILELLI